MGTRSSSSGWILGPWSDALVFSGPIVFGLGLVALGHHLGVLGTDVPPWAFALLIVGVDVAHVYSTAFRVYLDPEERARRPGLYYGVPLGCFLGGVLLHAQGSEVFWRVLAYLAVFHFIRQQWGWMAYTRRKAGEGDEGLWVDKLAIYATTIYPLLHWHTHLPQPFEWFLAGDFVSLPARLDPYGHVLHWALLALFFVLSTTGLSTSSVAADSPPSLTSTEKRSIMCCRSRGTSPPRSRRGGKSMGTTLIR